MKSAVFHGVRSMKRSLGYVCPRKGNRDLLNTKRTVDMACKEVFQRYFGKLTACLPMEDSLFLVKLSECSLIPGDTKDKIKSKDTQADKAEYFISHVIKPSLEVGDTDFDKLLAVMSESGYRYLKELSCTIKSEIESLGGNSKTSMAFSYI